MCKLGAAECVRALRRTHTSGRVAAINFIGATLLGIFTSGKIPAKLVPVRPLPLPPPNPTSRGGLAPECRRLASAEHFAQVPVTASRIVSAIVTIDAFNIYTAGKEVAPAHPAGGPQRCPRGLFARRLCPRGQRTQPPVVSTARLKRAPCATS